MKEENERYERRVNRNRRKVCLWQYEQKSWQIFFYISYQSYKLNLQNRFISGTNLRYTVVYILSKLQNSLTHNILKWRNIPKTLESSVNRNTHPFLLSKIGHKNLKKNFWKKKVGMSLSFCNHSSTIKVKRNNFHSNNYIS